jgi:hypothetical protein
MVLGDCMAAVDGADTSASEKSSSVASMGAGGGLVALGDCMAAVDGADTNASEKSSSVASSGIEGGIMALGDCMAAVDGVDTNASEKSSSAASMGAGGGFVALGDCMAAVDGANANASENSFSEPAAVTETSAIHGVELLDATPCEYVKGFNCLPWLLTISAAAFGWTVKLAKLSGGIRAPSSTEFSSPSKHGFISSASASGLAD